MYDSSFFYCKIKRRETQNESGRARCQIRAQKQFVFFDEIHLEWSGERKSRGADAKYFRCLCYDIERARQKNRRKRTKVRCGISGSHMGIQVVYVSVDRNRKKKDKELRELSG